jgi:hypothetical protein
MGISLSEAMAQVVRLAPHMEIAHHIPGRIRLKVLPSGIKMALQTDIQDVVQSVPGIRNVRVNPLSRSVVIEYDAARFPSDLWESILHLGKRPELISEVQDRLKRLSD